MYFYTGLSNEGAGKIFSNEFYFDKPGMPFRTSYASILTRGVGEGRIYGPETDLD